VEQEPPLQEPQLYVELLVLPASLWAKKVDNFRLDRVSEQWGHWAGLSACAIGLN